MEDNKTCSKCGESKALALFGKTSASKDGFSGVCKACKKAYQAQYYKDNKDKIKGQVAQYKSEHREWYLEYGRQYYVENKETFKEKHSDWLNKNPGYYKDYERRNAPARKLKNQKYREENREKVLAREALYRDNNREQVREATRLWARNNPDKVAAKNHKRRARRAEASIEGIEFTILDLFDRDGHQCAWCKKPVTYGDYFAGKLDYATVDHVEPLAKCGPHSMDNCVVACYHCNSLKCDLDLDEWLDRLQDIIQKEGDLS